MTEDVAAMKKRKLNLCEHDTGINLLSLDDDSLREILLRTRASDHLSLRLCCRRVCHILDSTVYRKERSEHGFAEVKVELLSPFEQYKKVNGYDDDDDETPLSKNDKEFLSDYDRLGMTLHHDSHGFDTDDEAFRVYVDGIPLHNRLGENPKKCEFNLRVELLPRKATFYGMCYEDDNEDLEDLSTILFTNRGNPKVASIKEAIKHSDNKKPLLRIPYFQIPVEYRSTSSTVGPLLIRAILKVFHNEYSLAIYNSNGKSQFTEEDKKRHCDLQAVPFFDEDVLEKHKEKQHFKALRVQDMRQFLRAGFSQVNDAHVVNTDELYVFTTPDQVAATQTILTEEETLKLPIAVKPLPPPKTGTSKELFNFIEEQCSHFKTSNDVVKSPDQFVANGKDKLRTHVDHVREKVKSILDNSKSNVSHLQIVLDSDAIQCCAVNQNLNFLKVMLERVPEKHKQMALNHLNHEGSNALMAVAFAAPQENIETGEARQVIESLIDLGADKNAIDEASGLSAFGKFILGKREALSMWDSFGLDAPGGARRNLEEGRIQRLLTPDQGATIADKALNLTIAQYY